MLQGEAQSHVFKDQRRMHQSYGSDTHFSFREVATVEFQVAETAGPEPSPDFVEVPLVYVHSNDPLCSCAVDLFQAVAAGYPKYRDALRKTVIESAFEEFRQDRQLLYAWGAHVAFVIFQRYGEPRIGHGLIVGTNPRFGMRSPRVFVDVIR